MSSSAPNVNTYWKYIKQDSKAIYKRQIKMTEIFERNSKRIQIENLGGTSSEKSGVFKQDLKEAKQVCINYYRTRDDFLNKQIDKSHVIDSMLKVENITVRQLIEYKVIR